MRNKTTVTIKHFPRKAKTELKLADTDPTYIHGGTDRSVTGEYHLMKVSNQCIYTVYIYIGRALLGNKDLKYVSICIGECTGPFLT